jgi:hypothetical protein
MRTVSESGLAKRDLAVTHDPFGVTPIVVRIRAFDSPFGSKSSSFRFDLGLLLRGVGIRICPLCSALFFERCCIGILGWLLEHGCTS